MTRLSACVMALGALVGGLGCASDPTQGYSFKSVHSEDVRTIAVPVFKNTTFTTGIEGQLTEAVIKEITRTTRWKISSPTAADTTLTGTITSSRLRPLTRDPVTGMVQEVGTELSVNFTWSDNRSGKVLTERTGFTAMDTFVATRNTGERLEVGQMGTIDQLAKDIVAELRSNW